MRIALLCVGIAACASPRGPWQSPLQREHPLVGKVWNGSAFVEQGDVEAAVRSAHFVLLGETHDNPDHHALQARLVSAAASSGRRPALVLEMLEVSQQPALDAAPRTPEGIARAVDWDRSGWPAFSLYRPVFEAALSAGLPIVAGNFTRAQMSAIVMKNDVPPEVAALLQREGDLPEPFLRQVRAEMQAEHCGMLPEAMLDPMARAQRARDGQLALRMAQSGAGSILIAGSGHVRTDRGVPAHLAVLAPGTRAVSVAMVEVSKDKLSPQDYARDFDAGRLPFDYVFFTPGAKREDPCKGLEKRLRTKPLSTASGR